MVQSKDYKRNNVQKNTKISIHNVKNDSINALTL